MPRGGKRPGAGAPKGNLNALKHGRHSRQLQKLLDALASLPEARAALLAHQRAQRREQRKARRLAAALLTLFFDGERPSDALLDRLQNDQRLFGLSIQHLLSEIRNIEKNGHSSYLSPRNDQSPPPSGPNAPGPTS